MSVRYQCTAEPAEVLEHQARVTVNLSLGILRCTGLKVRTNWYGYIVNRLLSVNFISVKISLSVLRCSVEHLYGE